VSGTDDRPRLNREWHLAHPMPAKASFEQRVQWHRAHAAACRCREMPEDIRKRIEDENRSETVAVRRARLRK
jgi:hypothetical protein